MQQIVLNQFEKISSSDINTLQQAIAQMIQDQVLRPLFGNPSGGVMGNGFVVSQLSAAIIQVTPGTAFFFDSAQTGFIPKFREIYAATGITGPVARNTDPSNNRIDLVCLSPNFAVTATAQRYVKTGGVGPVTLTTVNKLEQDTFTMTIVPGTASASPVAPSVPAGSIQIAQILNLSGSGGIGSIADSRTLLSPPTNITYITTVAINPASTPTYTLQSSDNNKTFLVNSANGAMTFNLPNPSLFANFSFRVKDVAFDMNTNGCTFHRHGSENFENVAADYIAQANGGEWLVTTDGTNWFIIGR